jgi:hypothetical protein
MATLQRRGHAVGFTAAGAHRITSSIRSRDARCCSASSSWLDGARRNWIPAGAPPRFENLSVSGERGGAARYFPRPHVTKMVMRFHYGCGVPGHCLPRYAYGSDSTVCFMKKLVSDCCCQPLSVRSVASLWYRFCSRQKL